MKISVAGFDPSFTHWGIAEGEIDLATGFLTLTNLNTVETSKGKQKQVRVNSDDLQRAEEIARTAMEVAQRCKVIFVEVPVGTQSANGMKAYGAVIGILGSIRALGCQIIEVTPTEVKVAFTNNKNATKEDMIKTAVDLYPYANFPRYRGEVASKAEHVCDAIAAIHAGVRTPVFQNLMRLLEV